MRTKLCGTVSAVAVAAALAVGCGGGSSKPDKGGADGGSDATDAGGDALGTEGDVAGADGEDEAGIGDGSPPADASDDGSAPGQIAGSPWLMKDIGDVGMAKGTLEINSTAFTISGGGMDVGGTADAFFFAYQKLTGDGEIVARVKSLLKATAEARVGIMIRADDTDPAAPHVFLALGGQSATSGVLRSRVTAGGTTAEAIDSTITEGAILRVARTGKIVTAYRDDGVGGWVMVGVVEIDLPAQIAIGVATSAGIADSTAKAELDIARVISLDADAVAKGWAVDELGTVGGSAVMSGGTITVAGLGDRTGAAEDVGLLVMRAASGIQTITAKVESLTGGGPGARVGLMIREGDPGPLSASAIFALMSVTLDKRAHYQNRRQAAGLTQSGASVNGVAAPVWIRLEKLDDPALQISTFTGFFSADGIMWNVLDSQTFPFRQPYSMGVYLLAGSASSFAGARLTDIAITAPK